MNYLLLTIILITITTSKNLRFLELKGFQNVNKAMQNVTKAAQLWTNIVSAFKTTSATTIRGKLNIDGYSKFKGTASLELYKGIPKHYWKGKKIQSILTNYKIKPKFQKILRQNIEETEFMAGGFWANLETLHNPDTGMSFFSILFNNRDDGKINIILSRINCQLQLAPDLLVINKSKSFLGGIFANSEDSVKNVPKSLTPDDLEDVMKFFQIFFAKNMFDKLGFKFELPEFRL